MNAALERYSWLAGVGLLVALSVGGYWFVSALRRNPPLGTIAVRNGQIQSFWLPDSSHVVLQGDSQLLYPIRGFGGNLRQVALRGQAYWEIRAGRRPLRIRCDSLYIETLGPASCNVRWRDGRLELTAISGRFTLRAPNGSWTLEEWQRLVWPHPAQVEAVEPFRYAQWRFGMLYFANTPLKEVLEELRRAWDLRLEADSGLLGRPVSGRFSSEQTFAEVLRELAVQVRARVVPTEDGWRLEGEG
ncbi:MAG: FecR domain-containing protein [Bacteroidetes bacterium]|nr:FecR domain-containing protein [Rhodothermia bacterium]MCS7154436.1 FecR domain-containing protein [Bacteroidota bacterium]MCX7906809.1 FecR domain-containing protein [Bacteroidota bacterium]MDW8136912.1 FecR domain-containing protein [Bacteroidota bacterium]MDW8285218.1 FecR domain-containing protein [Bacteroidota bacterium]